MISADGLWDERNRTRVLLASGAMLVGIAAVDWWAKRYFSLGFLYLFPIMLTARFLPRWGVALLASICAYLSEAFSSLDPSDALIRLGFEALALAGCGLFVAELLRNRRLAAETEERLRVLFETSPAAVVTVDERGFIERANRAAAELIAPQEGNLVGTPIAVFLPELHYALRGKDRPQIRASMQCHGHRGNGDLFLAEVWFSTYQEGPAPKLAAVIANVTEGQLTGGSDTASLKPADRTSLSKRETEVLRLVVQGLSNREIAAHLEISESAVKNTLHQLFAKTDVRTRSQLVRLAMEQYRDLLN